MEEHLQHIVIDIYTAVEYCYESAQKNKLVSVEIFYNCFSKWPSGPCHDGHSGTTFKEVKSNQFVTLMMDHYSK